MALVLACLLTGSWIRSTRYDDEIAIRVGDDLVLEVMSRSEELVFLRMSNFHPSSNDVGSVRSSFPPLYDSKQPTSKFELPKYEWNWERFGFGAGVGCFQQPVYFMTYPAHRVMLDSINVAFVRLPYWSVIAPLTLVSAWSLFSKPSQPKTSTQPNPEKAA